MGLREIRKLGPDDNWFFWSSDEKYVVYKSGSARRSDIWLLPLRTGLLRRPGNPIRLTNGPLPYSVHARAGMENRFLSSARSSAANWSATT